MENEMNPLKDGEYTVLKIKVTDADKAFDFIGKHILGKANCYEYGFSIKKMYLNEDRYNQSIEEEFKKEVIKDIELYGNKMIESITSKIK